jgi:mono/diheme cytochrome c family protein
MRRRTTWLLAAVLAVVTVGAVVTRGMGFTARAKPWAIEEKAARAARRWATPVAIRREVSPVAASSEALERGLKHWADGCAMCHGNNGGGETSIGRSLYPPAPDMRGAATQGMSDGELFYVIERGVPLTGMPARGTGTADGERASWELVLFIRHLPVLTGEELKQMEALNPRSPMEAQHQAEIDEFLAGPKKKVR